MNPLQRATDSIIGIYIIFSYQTWLDVDNDNGIDNRIVNKNEKEKCIRAKLYNSTVISNSTIEHDIL